MWRCSSAPPIRRTLSRWFSAGSRKRSFEQFEEDDQDDEQASAPDDSRLGPLDRAIAWIGEQSEGNFVLLAHETLFDEERPELGGYRKYQAVELQSLCDSYAGKTVPCERRNAHEIVWGPCKLYVDVEFARSSNMNVDGSVLVSRLVEVLSNELQRQFGVQSSVVVLDASKASKFSQHVTIEMDHGATAFASNRHCGVFIAQCYERHAADLQVWDKDRVERVPVYDTGVYSSKHAIRLYGSTKCAEPDRPFRRLGSDELPNGPYDRRFFLRSLITAPLRRDCRLLTLTAAETTMRLVPSKRAGLLTRTAGSAYSAAPESLVALVYQIPQLAEYSPAAHAIKLRNDSLFMCVGTNSKQCPIYGGTHDTQRIYFTVDLLRCRFRVQCHSLNCSHLVKLQPWIDISTEVARGIELFMQTEWSGGHKSTGTSLSKMHTLLSPMLGDFLT